MKQKTMVLGIRRCGMEDGPGFEVELKTTGIVEWE
jgi:hypothetical protein